MDIKPRPPPLSAIWSKLSPWSATSWPLLGAHVTLVPYEWTVPSIKKKSGNLIFVEMVVVTIKYRLTELRPKSLWQRQRKNCQQLSNLVLSGLFFVLVQKIFWPLATFGQISNTVVLTWVHSSPLVVLSGPSGPRWSAVHSFSCQSDKEHSLFPEWENYTELYKHFKRKLDWSSIWMYLNECLRFEEIALEIWALWIYTFIDNFIVPQNIIHIFYTTSILNTLYVVC